MVPDGNPAKVLGVVRVSRHSLVYGPFGEIFPSNTRQSFGESTTWTVERALMERNQFSATWYSIFQDHISPEQPTAEIVFLERHLPLQPWQCKMASCSIPPAKCRNTPVTHGAPKVVSLPAVIAACLWTTVSACSSLSIAVHDQNPWTHLDIENRPEDFHFAVVTDRTEGHRDGVFRGVMNQIILLRPALVISVGDLI